VNTNHDVTQMHIGQQQDVVFQYTSFALQWCRVPRLSFLCFLSPLSCTYWVLEIFNSAAPSAHLSAFVLQQLPIPNRASDQRMMPLGPDLGLST
jgi:hypothetical protein